MEKRDDLIEHIAQQIAAVSGLPTGTRRLSARGDEAGLPIAMRIDHTLLRPEATPAQINKLCEEAAHYRFASVCVNPSFVSRCMRLLSETPVVVGTVIGFPLGASTTRTKVFEAAQATADGARELDMVMAIGQLKAGDLHAVAEDMHAVVQTGHAAGALVKVIIETTLLNDAEKVAACLLAARAGADFVKTSTGFLGGGATVADIELMRRTVGPEMGVKASGGIRSLGEAEAMLAAGASRIGTSAGVAIVRAAAGVLDEVPTGSSGT